MKILIVASEYAIGMLPFASNLYNILSRVDGMEVYGIFYSKGNCNYSRLIDTDLHERAIFLENTNGKIKNLCNKFLPLSLYRTICDTADKHGIKNIHFVTNDFSLGFLSRFLRRKYTLFYTVHDVNPHPLNHLPLHKRFLNGVVVRIGTLQMIHRAHYVTTCSPKQVQQLKQLHHRDATFTPFPTLVSQEMKEGNLPCKEIQDIGPYILFFGGIKHYKGVEKLHDAYTNSPQLCEKYKLVITGQGTLNRTPHHNVVRISRFIDDRELKDLFNRATCIVYPYLSATMSGVLSVAYYYGTPLVMSDIDFFSENASKAAYLFATGDTDSLQHSLEKCLGTSPEEKLEQIAINQAFYNQIYADEVVQKSYIELYQQSKHHK